jgi:hypothetical protein
LVTQIQAGAESARSVDERIAAELGVAVHLRRRSRSGCRLAA